MSRYRKIHVKMWSSADFRALSKPPPSGQGLFVYLLTGEHTTAIPGLFVAGRARLAEDMGWPQEEWNACWDDVEARGMAKADWSMRLVYLPAALEHNPPANPNAVQAWRDEWATIPRCTLRDEAEEAFGTFLRTLGGTFSESWDNVRRNVRGNVPHERSSKRSGGRSAQRSGKRSHERSSDRSPEHSGEESRDARTPTRAPTNPTAATDPVPGLEGSGETPPERNPVSPEAAEILAMLREIPTLAPIARVDVAEALSMLVVNGKVTIQDAWTGLQDYAEVLAVEATEAKPTAPPTAKRARNFIEKAEQIRSRA